MFLTNEPDYEIPECGCDHFTRIHVHCISKYISLEFQSILVRMADAFFLFIYLFYFYFFSDKTEC